MAIIYYGYIQQPDPVSLSGNLKKIIFSSNSMVSFQLKLGDEVLIDESYQPDAAGLVEIDIKEVVEAELSCQFPNSDIFVQDQVTKTFSIHFDDTHALSRELVIIKGGVRNLDKSVEDFLKQHFLTWQPSAKKVRAGIPEWLTYYYTQTASLCVRFYLTDDTTEDVVIHTGQAGQCVTYNTEFSHLWALSSVAPEQRYGYVDLWVKDSEDIVISDVQRYVCNLRTGKESWFIFLNSIGGMDTITMTGARILEPEMHYDVAKYDSRLKNLKSLNKRLYKQQTGYLSMSESKWIWDFFNSEQRWTYIEGACEEVVLNTSSVLVSDRENLNVMEFSFYLTDTTNYLSHTPEDLPIQINHALNFPMLSSGNPDPIFIELLKKYIDNDTIYWDEENQAIKAKGGTGISEVVSVSVDINPRDINRCTIEAVGDVLNTLEDTEAGSYLYTVAKGGTVTINVIAKPGYTIDTLNVNQISQGAVDTYTFEDIQENSTMYVWMKELFTQVDVNFLQRSDLPSLYYSSLGVCLNAVKEDYPDGLTQDITITCVKPAIEVRASTYNEEFGIFVSSLKDWNQGSIHSLTIDGGGQYTINCGWLGGLYFEFVDNVYIKGIHFLNYSNYSGTYVPEETSAIFFKGAEEKIIRNIAMHDCSFNGVYLNDQGYRAYTQRCLIFKYVANIMIDTSTFSEAGGLVIDLRDIENAEITRCEIQGAYTWLSTLPHCSLIRASAVNARIILEDNIIDGTSIREYSFDLAGVTNIDLRRNIIKNCAGVAFNITSAVDNLIIESNVFYGNIYSGLEQYHRRLFGVKDVHNLEFRNNTVYMNGTYSPWQEFMAGAQIDILTNVNNIYADPLGNVNGIFIFNKLKTYTAHNNLYASALVNNDPTERFSKMWILQLNQTEPEEGYLYFDFDSNKLSDFQANGYESGSLVAMGDDDILDDDYKLDSLLADTHLSDMDYVPEFDKDYRTATTKATMGAYNLYAVVWDEETDTSTGYTGVNSVDNVEFDQNEVYTAPADDYIRIHLNSKRRGIFFKTLLIPLEGQTVLRYGKDLAFSLMCIHNEGMYISDNSYTIIINSNSYESTGIPE